MKRKTKRPKKAGLTHLLRLGPDTSDLVHEYQGRRGLKYLATALQILVRIGARRSKHQHRYAKSPKGHDARERAEQRAEKRNRGRIVVAMPAKTRRAS
jgi:hypothetical protein